MRLLFVAGAGFTGDAFADQLRAFPGSHAPPLPGHRRAGEGASIEDFAAFIEDYVAHEALADVVVCGHSMGAAVALELALRKRCPLAGIIAIGSGARLRVSPAILAQLETDFPAAAAQIAQYFFADPTPDRTAWAIESMLAVGRDQTLRDFRACDAFDATERLGEIGVPLLALTGEVDKMTPPKLAQALVDRVPEAQLRIVPQAGHFVQLERPAETNAAIDAFTRRIS